MTVWYIITIVTRWFWSMYCIADGSTPLGLHLGCPAKRLCCDRWCWDSNPVTGYYIQLAVADLTTLISSYCMVFKGTVSVKYECDDIDIKYGSGLSCFLLFDPNPNIPTPDLLYYNKFSFSFWSQQIRLRDTLWYGSGFMKMMHNRRIRIRNPS